jgi:Tfp pilus assembly protein PilV
MRRNPWRTPRTLALGFTLLEVMVGAGVLVIAIVGLLAVLTSTAALQRTNRETTLALNAVRDKLEELRNYPNFNELSIAQGGGNAIEPLARYYTQTGINPRSGLNYNQFVVTGLNPDRGWTAAQDDVNNDNFPDLMEAGDSEGDAVVGLVQFFTDETANDADARRVGMPLDCDGDGATITTNTVVDADTNGFYDYNLLPVTVRIEWRSSTGSRAMQVSTKLARRQ